MLRRGIALLALVTAACPHDFSRARPGDLSPDLGGDLGQPNLVVADGAAPLPDHSRPPDLLPPPDAPCSKPCVTTLPYYVYAPTDVVVDSAGVIYVVEPSNNRILRIANGKAETFAGGVEGFQDGDAILEAQFKYPTGLALDGAGTLYVGDSGNHAVRAVTNGNVKTVAGTGSFGFKDGAKGVAQFNGPSGVVVDAAGTIYVADYFNHRVRRIANGSVSTLAGDGTAGLLDGVGTSARLSYPNDLVLDGAGNIYVAESGNAAVRMIAKDGTVSTVTGGVSYGNDDGPLDVATFFSPKGLALDVAGGIYVADAGNNSIRLIAGGQVTTPAGDGNYGLKNGWGPSAHFNYPEAVAVDPTAGSILVADTGNDCIRVIQP